MLTKDEKDRLIDYFDPWELAEFLRVSMEDFVDSFEDEIEDRMHELNEIMGFKGDDDEEGI